MTLTAGRRYALRLEYLYNGGQGVSKLWWTPPGGTKQAVPASAFQQPAGGSGLRAEYFKGNDLAQSWTERVDPQVDFAWGTNPPVASASPGPTVLKVELPPGTWQAEWVDTKVGTVVGRTRIDGGGVRDLASPAYETDIALRLRRR